MAKRESIRSWRLTTTKTRDRFGSRLELIGVGYTATSAPFFHSALTIAYADAKGPAAANVNFMVQVIAPPSDAGTDH